MAETIKEATACAETFQRFGIINPYGGMWTWETFLTEDEAWAHVRKFWTGSKQDTDAYKVERVHLRVTRIPSDARPDNDSDRSAP